MKNLIIVLSLLLMIVTNCDGQEPVQLSVQWEFFNATSVDSVRWFEVASNAIIIDTIATVSATDTMLTFERIANNERHYFASKGYLIVENQWSPFSNIIDTLLISPPRSWWGKKK